MTSIREMDEFFDFEEAGITASTTGEGRLHYNNGVLQHTTSSAYDIDLILAEAANDQCFHSGFQQFQGDFLQPSGFIDTGVDTQMGYTEDFNDYSRWIHGAERPARPCSHCRQNHLQCTVMRSINLGNTGPCSSCAALSQQCSFSCVAPELDHFTDSAASTIHTQDFEMGNSMATALHGPRSMDSKSPSFRESSHENSEGSSKASGARFSRDTVRLLRNWLQVHHVHPYPTEEEKEDLKKKTGLTKVQITNWLANARRRGQVKPPRTTSPSPYSRSRPMNITGQTAKPFENLPLERWKNSPPENEAASVTAIAKAADQSPVLGSDQTSPDSYTRSEGSVHSIARGSSASSRSTTHSSLNSIGSAVSHHSRGSFGSFGKRGRRRRRHTAKPVANLTNGPTRQYQCTFCTESFKTKHDWQRHEKSLHLSLERWVCAPNKSKSPKKCVFCGVQNPTDKHYETHNHATCSERPLEERTFYRKDHLRQHLRLVHDCQFLAATMDAWKIAAPEVRSRCGFCGFIMDTWSARVDHLAEHFKAGKTMEEWKGGWGFESSVMRLVENGMPPYLIHSRRLAALSMNDPPPFGHLKMTPYDTLKAGLLNFANNQAALGNELTDDDLRAEACRMLITNSGGAEPFTRDMMTSWFKEMIMCPDDTVWLDDLKKKAGLVKEYSAQNQTDHPAALDIDDRDAVEKYCELERRLAEFVSNQKALGITPTDNELKAAGCRIVLEFDRMYSVIHSATAATWFCDQIMASSSWLVNFRERMGLPPVSQMAIPENGIDENENADTSIHTSMRLEKELAEFLKTQLALGVVPTDIDLQRQARLIIYEVDDGFFQTLADDSKWLMRFKNVHSIPVLPSTTVPTSTARLSDKRASRPPPANSQNASARPLYTLQDAKCYRRLELELSRFVASCMSPNAPNPHIPSDDEIRRQARWILYNDDNPWNQTAVDNAEWLLRFKRSNGLAPPNGKAMPLKYEDMDMHFGGVGLTPPSVSSDDLAPLSPMHDETTQAAIDASTRSINERLNFGGPDVSYSRGRERAPTSHSSTTSSGKQTYASIPKMKISTVFVNWKLESTLAAYAANRGGRVTDEELRDMARKIVGLNNTPVDEPVLLGRFREVYGLPSPTVKVSKNGKENEGQKKMRRTSGKNANTIDDLSPINKATVSWMGGERGLQGPTAVPIGYEGRIDPALLNFGHALRGDVDMESEL